MRFTVEENAIFAARQGETICIEAWGEDALRVRATMLPEFTDESGALTQAVWFQKGQVETAILKEREEIGEARRMREYAQIKNGRLRATISYAGVISFYREDRLLLQEYYRFYDGTVSKESRCLKYVNRLWKGNIGADNFSLTVKFESDPSEKIYGMGQYQQPFLDLKGCVLDLEQRNSQITVPFAVSSLGYGFLWNSPSVGRASFGKNYTEWTSRAIRQMDYWITAGDTPKEILKNYTAVTGRAPHFPRDRMGLWQCKLRYRSQEEVLHVARSYKEKGIPLDQIIIDFFHWTVQGDWKFDETYWPDVKAMVDELHKMGVKVMVSVWPSVDKRSENFYPMLEDGMLVKTERGVPQTYDYQGDCLLLDPFNPRTREYVWQVCKKNYYDLGIDGFWLDNAEPDLSVYDFENYRYFSGPALAVTNLYPQMYSRTFYEPMAALNEEKGGEEAKNTIVNLMRCAWAGSQRYANVIWSGDVPSSFEAFRDQLQAGLNMGLAGIPWWTTDIGGFMTDDVSDPAFLQLLIRWFQFAAFSPVLRMHGDRGPHNIAPLDDRSFGGGYLPSGQPNELYSYGEDCYRIMRKYLDIRLAMLDYIEALFDEAHENGSPLLRTMFYEFPQDESCWETPEQYMFGSRYLVAPILYPDRYARSVYLPQGSWRLTSTGELYEGGRSVTVDAPLDYMPVFEKVM